jgi:PPP family 3-phenylpropionic acid transporter
MALASLAHFLSVWSLPVPAQDRAAPPRTRLFSRPEDFDWSRLLTPQFLLLCAAAFVSRFGMSGYYSFFTLFVRNELGFQQAGYLWILGPVSEIPLIFFSTRIIARIGVRRMFLLGVGATALRLAGMAVARDVWVLIPLQLLHALTFGAFPTACIHFIQYLVPSSMKQVAVALFMAGTLGSAAIAGSAVGGVLVHRLGYSTMYGCFAAIALLGVVLARFLREPTPHATAASAGQPESVFESDDRQDA